MTHVPHESVTCNSCGRTFDRVRPKGLDSRRWAILREMGIDRRPTAICGGCYKLFMDWLDQKPTN